MLKICVFTEDTYGEDFFKLIISQLKKEGVLNKNTTIKIKAMPLRCSTKLDRILKLKEKEGFSRIIFIVDGDGKNELEVKQRESTHAKLLKNSQLIVIVNKYEIEEWLLYAYNRKIPSYPKPSIAIKELIGDYEKYQLPKILEKILSDNEKWKKLKEYEKFKEFLSAIHGESQ